MKLSVIIPAYNAERTIERCIHSLLDQEIQDYECIVVDDGSTDSTSSILADLSYKYPAIKTIRQDNQGVSQARNTGVLAAQGDYISFIDSDDYYIEKDYLSSMQEILDNNKDVDVVVSGYTSISQEKKVVTSHSECSVSTNEIAKAFEKYIETNLLFLVCTKMFRARILKGVLFEKGMSFGEDFAFFIDYLKRANKVAFHNNSGYGYEVLGISTTSDFRKNRIIDNPQTIMLQKKILEFWEQHLPQETVAKKYLEMRARTILRQTDKLLHSCRRNELLFSSEFDYIYRDDTMESYYSILSAPDRKIDNAFFIQAIVNKHQLVAKVYSIAYVVKEYIQKHI